MASDKDGRTAAIPQGGTFSFPPRCVCCGDEESVVRRDLEAWTPERITGGTGGFADVHVHVVLPTVPYCVDHAAELDAHLAKRRKEIRKADMPEFKILDTGQPAMFWAPPDRKLSGGTLGMFVHAHADVTRTPGSSQVSYRTGEVWLTFENEAYAALFREANGLMTQDESIAYAKEQRRAARHAKATTVKQVLRGDARKVRRMRKHGDVEGLVAALGDELPETRASALQALWGLRDTTNGRAIVDRALAMAAEDPDGGPRLAAVGLLGRVAAGWDNRATASDRASAVAAVITATKDELGVVRVEALDMLSNVPEEAALAAVIPGCDDADREVRIRAVNSVGAMAIHDALHGDVMAALEALRDHADPEIRERAESHIARIRSW